MVLSTDSEVMDDSVSKLTSGLTTGHSVCHVVLITDSEVMDDSVSKLTSGGVVCGNLALALRGKHRQHKPAWTVSQEVSHFSCFNVPLCTYIM